MYLKQSVKRPMTQYYTKCTVNQRSFLVLCSYYFLHLGNALLVNLGNSPFPVFKTNFKNSHLCRKDGLETKDSSMAIIKKLMGNNLLLKQNLPRQILKFEKMEFLLPTCLT